MPVLHLDLDLPKTFIKQMHECAEAAGLSEEKFVQHILEEYLEDQDDLCDARLALKDVEKNGTISFPSP